MKEKKVKEKKVKEKKIKKEKPPKEKKPKKEKPPKEKKPKKVKPPKEKKPKKEKGAPGEKKKKPKILIILPILILFLAAGAAAALWFTGAFEGLGSTKHAETAVNEMMEAFKNADFETAEKYIDLDDLEKKGSANGLNQAGNLADAKTLLRGLFSKLEYEIVSSEKGEKNTVGVKTKLKAVDMKPVMQNYLQSAFQFAFTNAISAFPLEGDELDKKMKDLFVECASKSGLAVVENEIDIQVKKIDDNWEIQADDNLINALLGVPIEKEEAAPEEEEESSGGH